MERPESQKEWEKTVFRKADVYMFTCMGPAREFILPTSTSTVAKLTAC